MAKSKKPDTERRFGGKKYYLDCVRGLKSGANEAASRIRRAGYNARIVKGGDGYAVYKSRTPRG